MLGPSATGLTQRLLVHGDMSAPILPGRLRQAVGAITPELVQRIVLRGRGMDFNSADLGRGRTILSEADPRREWKLAQHKQMRAIRARAGGLGWSMSKLGSNRPA